MTNTERGALDPTGRYIEASLHGPNGWCGETRPHTHGLSEGIITYTDTRQDCRHGWDAERCAVCSRETRKEGATMRTTVRVQLEIDLAAYRTEYNEPDATATDAREYAAALVTEAASMALDRFGSPGWATVNTEGGDTGHGH